MELLFVSVSGLDTAVSVLCVHGYLDHETDSPRKNSFVIYILIDLCRCNHIASLLLNT